MSLKLPLLIKTFKAGAAIAKHRIVVFGAGDGLVIQAAAVGDLLFGVNEALDVVLNEPVDVIMKGAAPVEYGAAVTRGQKLTTDAQGRAVPAAPGAGVNNQVIGVAMVSGVLADIGSVLIGQTVVQG